MIVQVTGETIKLDVEAGDTIDKVKGKLQSVLVFSQFLQLFHGGRLQSGGRQVEANECLLLDFDRVVDSWGYIVDYPDDPEPEPEPEAEPELVHDLSHDEFSSALDHVCIL